MRHIQGDIFLPHDLSPVHARLVLIELRDVTLADAPSTVISLHQLKNQTLIPNGRVHFSFDAPETDASRMLSLRVHVDLNGRGSIGPGDLLTTEAYPVPSAGDVGPLVIKVFPV
jgi:putative lipoprotein